VSLGRTLDAYTATIEKRGPSSTTTDVFGTPVEDVAVITVEEPCWVEQIQAQEILVGRETLIANYRAFFRPTANIDGSDTITDVVHNATGEHLGAFEILGPPDDMPTPRGPHHIEALLRRVTG
jgi:hypothetical protein